MYANIITFTFFRLFWPCFLDSLKIILYLNLLIWMPRQCLIVPLMFLQSWSNLLYQHFYAFALDNLCFFEHANESIHEKIHLTSIHRIYDDSKSNMEATIWSWVILYLKAFWKSWRKSLKKILQQKLFLVQLQAGS